MVAAGVAVMFVLFGAVLVAVGATGPGLAIMLFGVVAAGVVGALQSTEP